MCGIVGIIGQSPVNQSLYDALTVLQHRGQDAAGIVTVDNNKVNLRKDMGLVRDVFQQRHMLRMTGNYGIGHVRYPTAGDSGSADSQPFYVNSPYGICLAHNGNLTNFAKVAKELFDEDRRHLNTNSDSEVLLNAFAHELGLVIDGSMQPENIFHAVRQVHRRVKGGYAVVACVVGHGIVAFRDPYGIRPLVLGSRQTPNGIERIVASESVALDVLGFEMERDVAPGETIYIELDGTLHSKLCHDSPKHTPCIFEYVYFARPDSIIDNISVHKARMRMGERLAEKILSEWPDHDIDVVIPVPDTSRTSAMQLANRMRLKFREGFMKNRYIGRTFIMPGQEMRQKSVRRKLNAIDLEFRGKNVLLVDDSIVRGTTSKQIVEMAREAGASKVYFASAAPPVRYPNVYGIDMPASCELVAYGRTEQEVCEFIGADALFYQSLDDLIKSVHYDNAGIEQFDTSCFNGEYVTGDVTREFLLCQEAARSDGAKILQDANLDEEETAKIRGAL
jgi:amidophosphoribosyltransferase